MRRGTILLGCFVIPAVTAFSTVACSSNKARDNNSIIELECIAATESSSIEITEEINQETSFTAQPSTSQEFAFDSSETDTLTSSINFQTESNKVTTATENTSDSSDNKIIEAETQPPAGTKEENISHTPTETTAKETKAKETSESTTEQKTTKATQPTTEQLTTRAPKPTEAETTKATEKETKNTTTKEGPTTKATEFTTTATEPTTVEEPTTSQPSIYDYPFDVEAIRQEMIKWGEAMGLKHCEYDLGEKITPENYSWLTPLVGTKTFSGEKLKRKLKEFVECTPEQIEIYGGGKITWFCIYTERDTNGNVIFYYIY